MDPTSLTALEKGYLHLLSNKYYFLASTVVLLYDHLLTMDAEIIHIWRRRFSLPTYLFFVFRYATPLVSIIDLFAQHDPSWKGTRCSHWIRIPVAMAPIISATTGVILILRTHALYSRAVWNLYIIVPVYFGQLAVMGWALPASEAVQLPPGFVGCLPSKKPGTGNRLSYINVSMLVFDASIFLLTFARTAYLRLHNPRLPILQLVMRDGIIYFFILFIVNVINVILLSVAPPDLSAINCPFATIISSILVSRLMLNLREANDRAMKASSNIHGENLSTRPDICRWTFGQRTFAESILEMNEFDAPLAEWNDDAGNDMEDTTTASTTAVIKIDMSERVGNQDIELQSIVQEPIRSPVSLI